MLLQQHLAYSVNSASSAEMYKRRLLVITAGIVRVPAPAERLPSVIALMLIRSVLVGRNNIIGHALSRYVTEDIGEYSARGIALHAILAITDHVE